MNRLDHVKKKCLWEKLNFGISEKDYAWGEKTQPLGGKGEGSGKTLVYSLITRRVLADHQSEELNPQKLLRGGPGT